MNDFHDDLYWYILGHILGYVVNDDIAESEEDLIITNIAEEESQTYGGVKIESVNNNEYKHFVFYAESKETNSDIYRSTKTLPKDLFETEEDYEHIKNLVDTFSFNELLELTNNYLEKNPESKGNAYSINRILTSNERILDYIKIAKNYYDNVEQRSYVYYPGVEEINSNTHFISYIDEKEPKAEFGFEASDWLFFDQIIISSSDDDPIKIDIDYFDVNRDILSGAGIMEKTKPRLLSNIDLIPFIDSKEIIIRFKSTETEDYLDFEITSEEIQAYEMAILLRETFKDLSDSVVFSIYQEYYDK